MRPSLFCFFLFTCCSPFSFFFFSFCFARPKTKGLVFLSLTYMTHSFLIGVVLVLFFSSVPWILPGFSTRICYQTDLASGEWKNESASLAEYVERPLMLGRAVDVLCATSNFNSTSTLLQLSFNSLSTLLLQTKTRDYIPTH